MPAITRKHFRMLLTASLLCWAFAIIADATRHLPEPLASYEKQQTNTGDDPVSIAGMISFVGVLVSYVGLFLIRRWGRTLFISSMAILILLGLFERPIVETAAVDVLNSILMILFGAIIAVSFSTSIFDATDALGLKDFLADRRSLTGRILTRWKGMLQLFRNSKLGFISFTSALIVWIIGFTLLFANGVPWIIPATSFPML